MSKVLKLIIIGYVTIFPQLGKSQSKISQPYASHWYIEELLKWTPEEDKDAPFNISNTPLAKKTYNPAYKANKHARENEAKVNILSIFDHTSNNPSQGSLKAEYCALTYWQYIDLLVFWGGSAAEGIILAPNPGVIDAAHKHGVPVYGTVFFPPLVYGGKREWVYEFVQKDREKYPVADKLIEVAEYFGFDGWFINQESGNVGEVEKDSALARDMRDLMIYIQKHSDLGVEWYDAMMEDGRVKWQHELNKKNDMFFQHNNTLVSDVMFLDFRSGKKNLDETAILAEKLGRNKYEIFAGIDVQTKGYETKPGFKYPDGANFDVIFPEGKPHAASLALYAPSWTYKSSSDIYEFYEKESRLWVGENADPRKTETKHNWKGIAHYVPAKSTVNRLPFTTNFCTGHGFNYFKDGINITSPLWENGWNNMSLQEIQPTWRWIVESRTKTLKAEYDYTDAFEGGNCLKISGTLDSDNLVKLYSTNLKLNETSKCVFAYKEETKKTGKLKVALSFSDAPKEIITIKPEGKRINGWIIDTLNLSQFDNKEISLLALKIESPDNPSAYLAKIGTLGIIDSKTDAPKKPENIKIIENYFNTEEKVASIKISWEHSNEQIKYFRIYHQNEKLHFLGATTANSFYIPKAEFDPNDKKILLVIEAVGHDNQCSQKVEKEIKAL